MPESVMPIKSNVCFSCLSEGTEHVPVLEKFIITPNINKRGIKRANTAHKLMDCRLINHRSEIK